MQNQSKSKEHFITVEKCQSLVEGVFVPWEMLGLCVSNGVTAVSLNWLHNEHDGVSNHQSLDCLLNRLFRCRSKKTAKPRATDLCEGNAPVTGEFPSQRTSNVENASIWWRHHAYAKPSKWLLELKTLTSDLVSWISTLCLTWALCCWYQNIRYNWLKTVAADTPDPSVISGLDIDGLVKDCSFYTSLTLSHRFWLDNGSLSIRNKYFNLHLNVQKW